MGQLEQLTPSWPAPVGFAPSAGARLAALASEYVAFIDALRDLHTGPARPSANPGNRKAPLDSPRLAPARSERATLGFQYGTHGTFALGVRRLPAGG